MKRSSALLARPRTPYTQRSPRGITTFQPYVVPINIHRSIRAQKRNRLRYLLRLGQLSRRYAFKVLLPYRIVSPRLLAQVSPYWAWTDAIGCDSSGTPFACLTAREAQQAGFGSAVWAVIVQGDVGGLGGDVYYSSAGDGFAFFPCLVGCSCI